MRKFILLIIFWICILQGSGLKMEWYSFPTRESSANMQQESGQELIERYLDCGNPRCGFARIRCPDCHAEHLLMFSCRTRGFCPFCHAKRLEEWGEWMKQLLSPEWGERMLSCYIWIVN
jgi:ribosomal protein S27E